MTPRLVAVLVAGVVSLLVLAAPAAAHNVSVFPRFGDPGDSFLFTGTAWQANRSVRWFYDERNNGSFQRTGLVFTNRFGNFRFRWIGEDVETTHRMCFRQYDSRRRFQRVFFVCRRFTLLPS
jgi:hypothetical protein